MSRTRLFIENFFIYGLGNVLTKAVPFLMLPVLTRMIKDPAVFGIFDIYTIIIRFGVPLAVLGSYDAMFRLYFDDEDLLFQKEVCSSALAIVVFMAFIAFCAALILWLFGGSLGEVDYRWMILAAGVVISSQAIQTIVAAPTRMQNRRRTIILLSLLGPIVYYAIAMWLAWIEYPLEGLVFGNLFSGVTLLAFYGWLNRSYFKVRMIRVDRLKELLKIGAPLAPTFLIYWIFTSCDRFMIGHYLGMDSVGLYGVGARLSAISQGIYMAFAGGWQYFAFSTMKDEDHTELMSRVFEVLGVLSILSLLLLLPFVDNIFLIMVGQNYTGASVVFPYLFISPLLLMLSQIAGTQLQVEKKTYLSTITRTIGALVNVALNFILIPKWGIVGAAIATYIGYLVMTVSMAYVVHKMDRLIFKKIFLMLFFVGNFYILVVTYLGDRSSLSMAFALFFLVLVFLCYRKELCFFFRKFRRGIL